MPWITLPLSLWNRIMGRLRRTGVLIFTASETQWTGSIWNFVMLPRSAILFYTFNHGYSRHTGLSIPQIKENFITVAFRPSKQDLATFLERIWNRYYLDFFYLMKGGTFSTSDPVTLQSVTLIKAKIDLSTERAVNQGERNFAGQTYGGISCTSTLTLCGTSRWVDFQMNSPCRWTFSTGVPDPNFEQRASQFCLKPK